MSQKKALRTLKIFPLNRVRKIPFKAADTREPALDASSCGSSVNRNQEDTFKTRPKTKMTREM
jgi:hypothetical protein